MIGYDSYKIIVDYISDIMLDRSDYTEKLFRKLCEKSAKTDIVEVNMSEIKKVKIPENLAQPVEVNNNNNNNNEVTKKPMAVKEAPKKESRSKKKKSKHKNNDSDFANMRIVKKYGESFVKDSLTNMSSTEFMQLFECSRSTVYRLRQTTGILTPKRR